jgi:hypothetical protein
MSRSRKTVANLIFQWRVKPWLYDLQQSRSSNKTSNNCAIVRSLLGFKLLKLRADTAELTLVDNTWTDEGFLSLGEARSRCSLLKRQAFTRLGLTKPFFALALAPAPK